MADGGASKQNDAIKWKLLLGIKSTVDVLLASRNANIWSTYGGLTRIVDDLERILRHGLESHQDFFGESTDYDVILRDAGFVVGKSTGKSWLKELLLEHSLLLHLAKLMGNTQLMKDNYKDFAFLRSTEHCQALSTCLQAVEMNNPDILTQLNNTLVNKGKSSKPWTTESDSSSVSESWDTNMVGNETSKKIPEKSPDISETETHIPKYFNQADDKNVGITPECAESLQENHLDVNIESLYKEGHEGKDDLNIEDIENDAAIATSTDLMEKHDMLLAKEKLQFKGLKLVDSKTRKRKSGIDQSTLAQVALSVVMESDEKCTANPSSWFEGEKRFQRRRSSTINEVDILKIKEIKIKVETETGNNRDLNSVDSSDYKSKKALGHTRSKSDGVRLIKTAKQQQSVKEIPRAKQPETTRVENESRLSSSLPENSVEYCHNDPLSAREEETFASMLALQDLSSCELEKENAHFSISEALIQAIEQMKCDQIIPSDDEDEDEDDEEIQHLKLEIERRRLKKKREKLRLQPAFSDETPKSPSNHSSISDRSTKSSSSKSSIIDTDIDHDWEEISFAEEHATNLSNFSASESTLVPETNPSLEDLNTSIEFGASPPMSAEAVAKSLLKKFANKKHPAASELQWLVSENDVPQSLLPLPNAISVDPDAVVKESDERRKLSLPCRIRGNLEWAPPRFQIIFHVPPTPRRRQLMSQQNYRCTGCGMQVDPGYMKRFRYCNYLGKYFCSSCHNNSLMVIPARVVRRWDFRKCEVSKFAKDLLNKIHSDPLFNIKDLNPSIYQKVRVLENMKNLRQQLYFLKSFAQTCRKSDHLQQEFSRLPNHLLSEEHLYSIQDLIQVKSGELPSYFKTLVAQSLLHIEECPLCQAKGFICEYCRNGDDIIFPFELERVIQCSNCRASFHRDCYVEEKCPKCERIRIRKSLVAAPLSTYED